MTARTMTLEEANRIAQARIQELEQELADLRKAARDFYNRPSVMNEEALIIELQGGDKDGFTNRNSS